MSWRGLEGSRDLAGPGKDGARGHLCGGQGDPGRSGTPGASRLAWGRGQGGSEQLARSARRDRLEPVPAGQGRAGVTGAVRGEGTGKGGRMEGVPLGWGKSLGWGPQGGRICGGGEWGAESGM